MSNPSALPNATPNVTPNVTNVLIVEDELAIADMLTLSLGQAGYQTAHVSTAQAARQALQTQSFDLALVDWMLPGGSGLALVQHIRTDEHTRDMAVIMITARTSENDITQGLDAGADDYVLKPFSPKELQSRIRALLRRTIKATDGNNNADQILTIKNLSLNLASHRVSANAQNVPLNHTEFKLLRHFMMNPDRVFSRAQLLDSVWGHGTFIEERTVDVHVLRLRKALRAAGLEETVETVRGAGYRLPKT